MRMEKNVKKRFYRILDGVTMSDDEKENKNDDDVDGWRWTSLDARRNNIIIYVLNNEDARRPCLSSFSLLFFLFSTESFHHLRKLWTVSNVI